MSRPAWINVGPQDEVGTATVAAATNTLTIASHGLDDGDIVMVDSLTGGADGPLIEGAVYFVRNATTNTFQLSGTRGSQLKEFDSDGSADVYVAVPQYPAADLRRLDSALLYPTGDGLGARSGVRPHSQAVVTVSGTTWTVHPHSGVVYPGLTGTAGPYRYYQLSDSGGLNPADGSNPRIDAVDLLIEDDDEDASGFRRSRVAYTAGTPASSPSVPSLDASALRLATILVPAGGSPSPSVLTLAQSTVAAGGILPVASSATLPTAGRYAGMAAYLQDLDTVVVWDGGAWQGVAGGEIAERGTLFAELRQTSAQSIPNNTPTGVNWQEAVRLRDGGWSASPNPSRFTPPRAGLWMLSGSAAFAATSSGNVRECRFRINGSNVQGSMTREAGMSNEVVGLPAANTVVSVNGTSDFVEMFVLQDTGGSLNTFVGVARCKFNAVYVGPTT